MDDDKRRLLERYEATGDEEVFARARRLYERALAEEGPDADLLTGYGYLLDCHGRYAIRRASEQYQRATELDPAADKPHYQWILAKAALGEAEEAVARYRERLARSPAGVREHRLAATALLRARDLAEAGRVIAAGLALAPDDKPLLELRGELRAASGDPDGALADWRRAVDPDSNIGPIYSSAFLLERLGRTRAAIAAWESIIEWCRTHDAELAALWPRRELARLRGSSQPPDKEA